MRWLAGMLAAGAALVGLVAWIALRDYRPEGALHGQRTIALHHATQLMELSEGGRRCAYCRADIVGPLREHVWRVTVQMPHRLACFDVDNDRFALGSGHGLSGVRAARCPDM